METQFRLPKREKLGLVARYLRGNVGFFAAALLCACLSMVCNALTPQIIRITVDSVLGQEGVELPGPLEGLIRLDWLRANPIRALLIAAGAVVAIAALRVPGETMEVRFTAPASIQGPRLLGGFTVLFALCLLSVFHVLHYGILLIIVAAFLLIFRRDLFKQVDYSLLATFVCFFVFAGNLGNIGPVREALEGLMAAQPLLASAIASQVISNVPAAVLLSGFTADWRGLLIGTNVGGLGTPIASLASLISLRLYLRTEGAKPLRYLGVFSAVNFAGLALLLWLAGLWV